jgi:hypothetical protein
MKVSSRIVSYLLEKGATVEVWNGTKMSKPKTVENQKGKSAMRRESKLAASLIGLSLNDNSNRRITLKPL